MSGITTPANGHTATKTRRDLFRQVAWTLLGFTLAVGLAAAVVAMAVELSEVDHTRVHIPGHQVLLAAVVVPGLFQLVYIIPLRRSARRRGLLDMSRGLLGGAIVVAVLNFVEAWLILSMPRFD